MPATVWQVSLQHKRRRGRLTPALSPKILLEPTYKNCLFATRGPRTLLAADNPCELLGRALPLRGAALHEPLEFDRCVLAAEQYTSLTHRLVAGERGVLADTVEGIGGPEEGALLGK